MAQGNWNILFQKGPFSEFQRHMAIGDHFALRGEISQAEFYYRRAETALDIAYASLRSRYDWPRSPAQLRADELPWGENRETFRDYLLCRLQLYVESGLSGHDLGKISLERLSETVARTEVQMGQSLRDKDGDLENFLRLIREGLALRSAGSASRGLRAARFAELSASIPPSARNYWLRRTLFFQIQEHLYYGNLGLARALTDFLFARHGDQSDALAIARFYIQSSDFGQATELLEKEFARNEVRSADNYPDFLRISEMLQNLHVWKKQYLRAAQIARDSHDLLQSLIADNLVPREELVSVRRSAANQKLRSEMLLYLARGECPAPIKIFAGNEPEAGWRIRERLFYQKCGLAEDRNIWLSWLSDTSLGAEVAHIIRFVLGEPYTKTTGDTRTPLMQFLSLYRATEKPYPKAKQAQLAASLLDAGGKLHSDLVFLDWGLTLPSDTMQRAFGQLKAPLGSNDAALVFSALHRQYVRRQLRGNSLFQFAASDAAELRAELQHWILGGDSSEAMSPAALTGGDLLYADHEQTILYQSGMRDAKIQIFKSWENLGDEERKRLFRSGYPVRLFGAAAAQIPAEVHEVTTFKLAPLFSTCSDCVPAARTPARILFHEAADNSWRTTRADLADIFSHQQDLKRRAECAYSPVFYQDTLIVHSTDMQAEYPCDMSLENLILEEAGSSQPAESQRLLWAIAGRQTGVALFVPQSMNPAARTAFLFDFLQRRNRREVPPRQAFSDARRRAEKSFPPGSGIESVRIYAVAE